MRLERYGSVESYAQIVKDSVRYNKRNRWSDNDWDQGVDFTKAIQLSIEGDPTTVSKYSEFVDKLVNDYSMNQDNRKFYESSIAGSRVSVPEYLAGSPRCMKKRAVREMTVRSVNIYVSTTCSAGIAASNMLKRGSVILALLEYLQMTQIAVDLFLLAETHGRTDGDLIQIIQVQSHPLDLSTAGFAIAHPAFARHITYDMARFLDGFNGSWGRSHFDVNYVDKLRQVIGMNAGDIYVPAAIYGDDMIMSKPEQWLKERIEVIKGTIE